MPMWPSGSSVTSGEFWNPWLVASVATSAPERPSKMSMPLVVGTMTSWYPPPVRSAVTGEPATSPLVDADQMVAPLVPFST